MGQYSLSTRATEWYRTVTLATRFFIFVCVSLYIYGLLFGFNLSLVCMQPYAIVDNWRNVYTFLSAGFFHFSFLHILFNMMSFYPMGSALERLTGTLPFFYLIILFDVVGSLFHLLLASLMYTINLYPNFYYSCSAGFSGVIFTIITIECHNNDGARNIFGFAFPARLYPWITLFFIQMFFGNVSFLGHLSGILVGYLYVFKILDPVVPVRLLNRMEGMRWVGWVVSMNGYITNPNFLSSLPTTVSPSASGENHSNRWQFNFFSPTPQAFPGTGRVLGSNLHIISPPSFPPPKQTPEKSETQST